MKRRPKQPVRHNALTLKRLGIDTQKEFVIFLRADSHVCRSEGFEAQTRIVVTHGSERIVATLNIVHTNLLGDGEAGLSESAFRALGATQGDTITVSHLRTIDSFAQVRAKMYGHRLDYDDLAAIVHDVISGIYSNVHLAAFVSACAGDNLRIDEIVSLTKAMLDVGQRLHWDEAIVVDKHCVGGLPGNRTTPVVVSIAAAVGLTIPKTSSRAITSPAGTADTLETITCVNLSMQQIRDVVRRHGGCMTWGGTVQLSPADDILIGVERALDVDSEGQMIASVLSKKAAAGSTHVIVDMPVGPTAKVRTREDAEKLTYYFYAVAHAIGLEIEVLQTDGYQPVGRGIGPALEARDVLAVLRGEADAPQDLRERSLSLAAALIELVGKTPKGGGLSLAAKTLDDGKAYEKFHEICVAQGGFREPGLAPYQHTVRAVRSGTVIEVDNRKLAKVAKLAGAPKDPLAGLEYLSPLGRHVEKGEALFVVHAESEGELEYALDYLDHERPIVRIE